MKRVDRRLVLPRTAKAQSNAREETATNVPSAEKASLSLVRTLNDRSATGRSRGVELWAEDESVFRQQLEYLDLGAVPPAISTISLDFSSDGCVCVFTCPTAKRCLPNVASQPDGQLANSQRVCWS